MKEEKTPLPLFAQDAQDEPSFTRVLVQVAAPHFTAGIVCDSDRCLAAAPICGWMIGKTRDWLREYFKIRGWKATVVLEFVE